MDSPCAERCTFQGLYTRACSHEYTLYLESLRRGEAAAVLQAVARACPAVHLGTSWTPDTFQIRLPRRKETLFLLHAFAEVAQSAMRRSPKNAAYNHLAMEQRRLLAARCLQSVVRVCPWTMVGSFRMNFPRRFSDFGMKRACAQRLQAVFRRTEPHMHYRQMIPAGVCIGGGAMRALYEWKYRRVLTRKSLQKDMPATIRRRMFVDAARLDPLNTATYDGWMATFRRLQGLCAENHEVKRIETDTKAAYKELVDYEARLYNDIERGGGGGLVRTLGGVKVHVPATGTRWPASLAGGRYVSG
jgi:hypothetical protein